MITIGIDPGKKGYIAFLKDGKFQHADPIPLRADGSCDVPQMIYLLDGPIDAIVVEKLHSRPGQSAQSTFSLGRNYEAAYSAADYYNHKFNVTLLNPTPQTWKKITLKDTKKDKPAAILKAGQLFPELRNNKNDNMADAALIAWYGWQMLKDGK